MSYGFQDLPNQYPTQPPRPNKATGKVLAVVFAGTCVLVVLGCCGGGLALVNFGVGMAASDIEMQLRDHPTIQEHIGEIESMEANWTKSINEESDDIWYYDVKGSKGSGELKVDSIVDDLGGEEIRSATLRTSTGKTIELDLDL